TPEVDAKYRQVVAKRAASESLRLRLQTFNVRGAVVQGCRQHVNERLHSAFSLRAVPELGHPITEDVQNAVWRHRHVTCGKTRVWKNARADVRCVEQTGLIGSARSKHGGWV